MKIEKNRVKEEKLENTEKNLSSITTTQRSFTRRLTTSGKDYFKIYDLSNMNFIFEGFVDGKNKTDLQIIQSVFNWCEVEDHTAYGRGRPDYKILDNVPFWVEMKRKRDGLSQAQIEWLCSNKNERIYCFFLDKKRNGQLILNNGQVKDVHFDLLPPNAWSLMAVFAKYKRSYSVGELVEKFREGMHVNTIRSMIKRLVKKSYLKISAEHTGRTRSEKRYIMTLDGLAVWEMYKDR